MHNNATGVFAGNPAIAGYRFRALIVPGRHVDFMLGAIDKRNVDVLEVFRRCVVNDRRGISATRRREQREEKAGRDARACAALHTNPC